MKINNIEALKSIINLDVDMIYYEDVATLEQAMAMAVANNKKLIYSAPRIVRNKEYKRLEKSNEYCKENVSFRTS